MDVKAMMRAMDVALGKTPADLAITNAKLVNVATRRVEEADILVAEGIIAAIQERGSAKKGAATQELDAGGRYLLPGLLDAHTHIEMSFLSAVPYAECVLPLGTTGIMVDPHDMVNATGLEGLRHFAAEMASTPLKCYLMVPPCIPSSPDLEDAAINMTLQDMKKAFNLPSAHGIAETMDFSRVLAQEQELLHILSWSREQNLLVDGHCPELRGRALQAYALTGPVLTDHESVTVEEMQEKYRLGMRVIIRRGSLSESASAGDFVNSLADTSNVLLSTDGCITVHDILTKGHMNYALRCVVEEGVDPLVAVQMGTINVARAYGLSHRVGIIAPGRAADLVLVNNLHEFKVEAAYLNGRRLPAPGKYQLPRYAYPQQVLETVKLKEVAAEAFRIKTPAAGGMVKVRAIAIIDETVATAEEIHEMQAVGGELQIDPSRDLLKAAVFERYGRAGTHATAIVKGFGLKKGALAGSVAQDTQNIVAVGASDEDMALAVNTLKKQHGGIVLAEGGKILANIKLPIGGIMTDIPPEQLQTAMADLNQKAKALGSTLTDPIFSLYMQIALAVIPEIRLTNRGLVHVASAQFIPLWID
ncbi:MAG: adenine deaminase C-terminal domain-containing protein [Clostridia bacterium]|nr:adenine deaminase C-terminal domain-containing protein [Clostridia bacterium]